MLTVLDYSQVYMRAYVPEGNIGSVRIGDKSTVYLDAMPNKLPVLLGNSGVGKSSLAQAGVLAALNRQAWPEAAGTADPWPASCKDSHSGCTIGRRRNSARTVSTVAAAVSRINAASGVSPLVVTVFERMTKVPGSRLRRHSSLKDGPWRQVLKR